MYYDFRAFQLKLHVNYLCGVQTILLLTSRFLCAKVTTMKSGEQILVAGVAVKLRSHGKSTQMGIKRSSRVMSMSSFVALLLFFLSKFTTFLRE